MHRDKHPRQSLLLVGGKHVINGVILREGRAWLSGTGRIHFHINSQAAPWFRYPLPRRGPLPAAVWLLTQGGGGGVPPPIMSNRPLYR